MFDNICKYLAETYSSDIASWLLGESISLTQVQPQELAVEPIRADSLILLEAEGLLLHLEFQTKADPQIPFRMLDYWVRGKRRFPDKKIRQFVIYLRETSSNLVFQQAFQDDSTYHRFGVIRLWEQPVGKFLEYVGMLPFAILVGQGDKERLLQGIAEKIDHIDDLNTRETISAATYVLAGMVLEENIIKQILRRDIMQESVTYQAILREGRQEGLKEGLKEGEIIGRKQGLLTIILRLLTRKFGTLPPKLHTRIARLQIPRLESLAEAILDFESVADLELWLNKKK
ncbi:Rpn family recombination-promoting nuclease/putative transposase [Pseudanabaena yagii]|uniref:Rpn family recombination-promoting nuclease/putative transposase n=1 Tax=Pseudanabaena yagii GIHE-NHR1 TaxID=2722753 RepID=A0ABX1LT52_9CYAN|nr:Rpn family recombination-promoting nuclease/putative transposase [Pseudanabaena yagii]NMF57974.1 Rpn family recombination-promoting nuclease/putative transposase [Pseudanabaena yagii GIHE-NHR1]